MDLWVDTDDSWDVLEVGSFLEFFLEDVRLVAFLGGVGLAAFLERFDLVAFFESRSNMFLSTPS
jgi:hypothetical protein